MNEINKTSDNKGNNVSQPCKKNKGNVERKNFMINMIDILDIVEQVSQRLKEIGKRMISLVLKTVLYTSQRILTESWVFNAMHGWFENLTQPSQQLAVQNWLYKGLWVVVTWDIVKVTKDCFILETEFGECDCYFAGGNFLCAYMITQSTYIWHLTWKVAMIPAFNVKCHIEVLCVIMNKPLKMCIPLLCARMFIIGKYSEWVHREQGVNYI